MKYYRSSKVPKNVPIWGCAYETTYNEKGMFYKKEPVLGMIVEEGSKSYFCELKKNGGVKKSNKVSERSRLYADTLEESIEIYNECIDDQIRYLENLIKNHVEDKIVK